MENEPAGRRRSAISRLIINQAGQFHRPFHQIINRLFKIVQAGGGYDHAIAASGNAVHRDAEEPAAHIFLQG